MPVPAFKMHGSKARTAAWIANFMPFHIQKWIEPFAGRGNVYFRVMQECDILSSHINDINTAPFLCALRDHQGNFDFVDEGPIDKALWLKWKNSPPSEERTLAECYVARFGSSYEGGPNTAGGDSKNGHSKNNTIERMKAARNLLQGVDIQGKDWLDFLSGIQFEEDDVLYVDPPYNVKQAVHYKNIDHVALLNFIESLRCHVYVSGYSTELYETRLAHWHREVRVRASVGKGVASKGKTGLKPKVEEILWWK